MTPPQLDIKTNQLSCPQVLALISEHLQQMASQSPAESVHALDVSELKKPDIIFCAAWTPADELAGIAALKILDSTSAEIKSMRTSNDFLRQGVATELLKYLIALARQLEHRLLYLETGSQEEFTAARMFYKKFGFTPCDAYADYSEDPNSVFMKLHL